MGSATGKAATRVKDFRAYDVCHWGPLAHLLVETSRG